MSNRDRRATAPEFRGAPASYDEAGLRVPPHSILAEQAVLGGLMLSTEAYDRVAGLLTAGDFYRRDHRLIYQAIEALAEAGSPYDAVTLGEWFEARGEAELIGGGAYIIELSATTPSAANVAHYAQIVRDRAMQRQLIDAAQHIADLAFNPVELDITQVVDQAEQRIFAIGESATRSKVTHTEMRPLTREIFRQIQDNYQNQRELLGLSTGYEDLDAILRGLRPSDLIVIAARPAMGKTALALQIADHAASRSKKCVAFFSMEMSAMQLGFRLVSLHTRLPGPDIQRGNISDEGWPKLTQAAGHMVETPLLIDDTGALSPADLRARARRMAREHGGLALIVIDYLQLMQVPGNKENRATEVSEISRSLKALAKELDVPVIALSQLNRSLESRSDKRPVMADLRESGAIEQDADAIVFIYRDEYYHPDSSDKGIAEIIVSKHRHGPTGMVKLAFNGACTRFDNLAPALAFYGAR